MIEVQLLKEKSSLGLLVEGHAQKTSFKLKVFERLFGVGKDLDCSAVSAQVAMLELGISKILKLPVQIKKKEVFFI